MTRTRPTNADIAVVGAGPGGLSLAVALQRRGLAVTVYERDTAVDSRSQGGTLDMHADTGQIALAGTGLLDRFHELARPEGRQLRALSPHGKVLKEYRPSDDEDAAPEIDRGELRELLAGALEPGTVRWGSHLKEVSPDAGGRHTLRFADGSDAEADLVVGADGAWSRVRPLVSDVEPEYSGVCFVEAHFPDVAYAHPTVAELVGDGLLMVSGDGRGLVGQRMSDGRVVVYVGLYDDPDWHRAAGADPRDTPAMRAALLERFDGWDPRLLTMITENDGSYVNRPIYAIPAPHSWPYTPGVTLVGDAGHLRTPLGGNGANLAMLEGYELAAALAEHDTIEAAVREYERMMQPRNVEAGDGIAAIRGVFGPGEYDPDAAPDFEQEAENWKQRAAEYDAA